MDRPPLSLNELLDAFDRVARNQGCAGVDAVTVHLFGERAESECEILLQDVLGGQYRALPLLRIVVEKKPGSSQTRTFLVPAVRDRVLQTAVAVRMSCSYEEEFLESSYAYRPGRGVDRAVARIRQLCDVGYWHVLDADIRGYFDSVDFALLEARLREAGEPPWVLSLVSEWLRAPLWDGQRVRRRSQGLPQGSPLSPLLANAYLQPLDVRLSSEDWKLVRYADDFIVLTRTPEEASRAASVVAEKLAELKLSLHPEKTRLASFDTGFHFLGVYFQKDDIYVPWKDAPRQPGRILRMARPMREALLARYRRPPDPSALGEQLERAGIRWIEPAPRTLPETTSVAFLYLTEQGSTLRKSGDRLLVERDGKLVLDIPYHKLEHVMLFGNVQVTTQAVIELLEKGVDLSYFSWQGVFRGSLTPAKSTNSQDRLAQYQLWKDPARDIVANKIANAVAVLEFHARRRCELERSADIRANPE